MKHPVLILFLSLFFSVGTAQEQEIIAISEDACECISDIDLESPKSEQYEEIQSCITSAIISHQLKEKLLTPQLKKGKDSKSSDLLKTSEDSVQQVNIEINTDKNYKEIESYSLRNCPAMKRLMSSNNKRSQSSVSDKKKAIEFYNKGQQYFEAEQYGNAIVEFSKAVKNDKNFVFAWDNLGLSYRKNGQLEQAIESYKKSLKIEPTGKMSLINIPVAYEKMGDFNNAIKGYKELIAIYPDDPEGYYGLGRMYHAKKEFENALENMMNAYLLYKEQNSPYIHDAESNISLFYSEMKENGQLQSLHRIADKYNIKIQE